MRKQKQQTIEERRIIVGNVMTDYHKEENRKNNLHLATAIATTE